MLDFYLGEADMDLEYHNDTLNIEVFNDINFDTITILERRIFELIDELGISKIYINISGKKDITLLTNFKRNYYHKYKGFLLIE